MLVEMTGQGKRNLCFTSQRACLLTFNKKCLVKNVTVTRVTSKPFTLRSFYSVPDSAPLNVTSLPANTTALTVKWFPVIEEDRNGVILGYRVALSNITGEFMRNVSVHGSSTLSFTLGGLDIWTNYSLEVCAFTVKGNGPWSAPLIGITDEEGTLCLLK